MRVTPSPAPTYDPVRVQFVLRDRATGRRRSDIPFTYRADRGPTVRAISGPEGTRNAELVPGFYRAQVLTGCHARAMVTLGGRARFGVAPEIPMQVPIDVSAQRRFHAGPPALWNVEPPWPRGRTVTFRFLIHDRCTSKEAPNTSFEDLRYAPSSNLEIVGTPVRRSDGDSLAAVQVRCTGPGDARLVLHDPQNAEDRNDLLTIRAPLDPNATWCA